VEDLSYSRLALVWEPICAALALLTEGRPIAEGEDEGTKQTSRVVTSQRRSAKGDHNIGTVVNYT